MKEENIGFILYDNLLKFKKFFLNNNIFYWEYVEHWRNVVYKSLILRGMVIRKVNIDWYMEFI